MTLDISHAVRGLLEARSTGIQMAPPFALPDRDAVYAIQDGVARATGPVAGWKVGARTPTAEPNPAPLLAGALVKSPARFDGEAMHMIGVEIEISFHIAHDIAARDKAVGREEALAAVGDAVKDWARLDWPDLQVTLLIDGSMVVDQRGGLGAVDPVRPLAWMIDHAVRRRGGIRAGQAITTGSWTGLRYYPPGTRARGEFVGLGGVEVRF